MVIPFQKKTVLQQLLAREIEFEQALNSLVDEQGFVNFSLLDSEVSKRFFKEVAQPEKLPPLLPLLLWQNCYYLGCPTSLSQETLANLQLHHNATKLKIIPITEKSYSDWLHLYQGQETSPAELQQITESKIEEAETQIQRIQAIIESALRSSASDIHFQPLPEGLKIRYRIDGILRDITTLPFELSRPVLTALKVMAEMDIAEHRIPQDGRIGAQYSTAETIGENVSLRVNTLPCLQDLAGNLSEKAVLRILRQQNPFTSIRALGFTESTQSLYRKSP